MGHFRLVLGYHTRILWILVKLVFRGTDWVITCVAVITFVLLLFNRPIGQQFDAAWRGLDPWIAAVPLILLAAYGVMSANYTEIERRDDEVERLRLDALVTWHEQECQELKDRLGQSLEPNRALAEADRIASEAKATLATTSGKSAAAEYDAAIPYQSGIEVQQVIGQLDVRAGRMSRIHAGRRDALNARAQERDWSSKAAISSQDHA